MRKGSGRKGVRYISQSITQETGQKLSYTIIAVVVLAPGYFAHDKFALSAGREAALVEATTQAISEQAATEESIGFEVTLPN